ncbi:MAG TPA: response regulator transcription factor [Candidatus Limnocylindrales bacterium]|nr:response regulator transcription factor [Candidatus Limnocylindrales bacterium]
MTPAIDLDLARAAFDRHEWASAARAYLAADRATTLDARDLGQAALAAHLAGDDDASTALMTRSHQAALDAGDPAFAAYMAFWLGMELLNRGEFAVGVGWFARSRRVVEEHRLDCVASGYLLVPPALEALDAGDPATAFGLFEQAAEYAERFAEPDLATLSRLGRGQSLISMGEVERGVALLDDAMLGVTSGEVGPVVTGIVYCASIEAFHEIYDLRRAQGWTEALTRWRNEQPDLVPFHGRCLVYRADLMRFHGDWSSAMTEVRLAQETLLRPPPEPAAGEAFYLEAELARLRGDLDAAETAYRAAAGWGRRAEPGLARLRLAQGRVAAARTMLTRAIDEAPSGLRRAPLLEALVSVAIADGDLDAASAAADELSDLTTVAATPLLSAVAATAEGEVRLASGEALQALTAYRRASDYWQTLDAPYESARVREGIGLACRALRDADGATMELQAARDAFERLGAAPDVRRLDALLGQAPPTPGGLSAREVEVIRALAAGRTNREIATSLGISERTVDRHVSNIFTKLDVSSRAAATAFAYEQGLV